MTAETLAAERRRMARRTRFPVRLRAIYRALGNDTVRVQKCVGDGGGSCTPVASASLLLVADDADLIAVLPADLTGQLGWCASSIRTVLPANRDLETVWLAEILVRCIP